jgi:hypothetical protein
MAMAGFKHASRNQFRGFLKVAYRPWLICWLATLPSIQPALAFPAGAITCQGAIDFNANIVTVDSFDSLDPLHSSWLNYPFGLGYGAYTNTGSTPNPYRKANGNIATDSQIFSINNTTIFGHIAVGPNVSITLSPKTSIGNLNWVPDTMGIQPGYFTNNMTAVFRSIFPPDTNWISLANNTKITNSGYYAMDMINDNMLIGGRNTITVTLLLTNGIRLGGIKSLMIASNAWVTLYAGNQINDGGNGSILNTSRHAPRFVVYGLPTLTSIKIHGNGAFYGLVYAPNALAEVRGFGASGGYYGAFVYSNIVCTGNTSFSFDESLTSILETLLSGSALSAFVNRTNNQVEMTITGYPGCTYVLQSTTNLMDWISVSTNTSPFYYSDSEASSSLQRFYRAVAH